MSFLRGAVLTSFVACVLLLALQERPAVGDARPAGAAAAAPPLASPAAPRPLVALADMHGSLDVALESLRLAGVVDSSRHWCGGATVLVQTGDLVDRGADSVGTVKLFLRLKAEAEAAGGHVHLLIGNHEAWALSGVADYVASSELRRVGGRRGWAALFGPAGKLGRSIQAHHEAAVVAGEGRCRTLFVHAGLPASLIPPGGSGSAVSLANARLATALAEHHGPNLEASDPGLFGANGPFWTRVPSTGSTRAACAHVDAALSATGAARMVVGHTVQEKGARTRCGGRLVLLDTGASYYDRPTAWGCSEESGAAVVTRAGTRAMPLKSDKQGPDLAA